MVNQSEITIEIEGAEAVSTLLNTISERLSNLEPIWDTVAKRFFELEAELIRSQGYGSWAPLSAKYAEWKSHNYPGKPLLVLTGTLQNVMTGNGAIVIKDSQNLMIGFTQPDYAKFHQSGTRKMPARPLIIMNEQTRQALSEVTKQEIIKLVNRGA